MLKKNLIYMMNFFMNKKYFNFSILKLLIIIFLLNSCGGMKGGDARKIPANMKERQRQNIEEGRGFRLGSLGGDKKGGTFSFASSNELWRASLDTLEFMPLALANYSGGIVVTDWYSDSETSNESVKISVRFLSNEIRSDALIVKVFYKNCSVQQTCKITDRSSALSSELTEKILAKAAVYEKENQSKNKKKYINKALED